MQRGAYTGLSLLRNEIGDALVLLCCFFFLFFLI